MRRWVGRRRVEKGWGTEEGVEGAVKGFREIEMRDKTMGKEV